MGEQDDKRGDGPEPVEAWVIAVVGGVYMLRSNDKYKVRVKFFILRLWLDGLCLW